MSVCSINNCDKKVKAFGWCTTHYMRYHKYGDPTYTKISSPSSSLEDRLKFYGWIVTNSDCWEWNGSKHRQGYGRIHANHKMWLAHVLAYTLWIGDIPQGMKVRHTCDNPPCINPEHLMLGTQADNVQDMVSRGRARNKQTGKLNE